MSKLQPDVTADVVLAASRSVLLDALRTLSAHNDGMTIVGAQAIYLRAGGIDLGVAPTTSDADFVLHPDLVAHPPEISTLLREAEYQLVDEGQPGLWSRLVSMGGGDLTVGVDLLVPDAVGGAKKSRSAKVPPHEKMTAKRVPGLEAALVDRDRMTVQDFVQLEECEEAWVAGPAALLIAKSYKLAERVERVEARPDRLVDKDATDVVRLMMATDPEEVAERWTRVQALGKCPEVYALGRTRLADMFGGSDAPGLKMAQRNLEGTGFQVDALVSAWMGEFDQSLPN